jgi:hypothetical protein
VRPILLRAIGSTAAAIALSGCAGQAVAPAGDPAPAPVEVRPGRPEAVVSAPHGASDPVSGEIAREIARRTGLGLVVARGAADQAYEARVQEAAQGPLAFHAEIHGTSRPGPAEPIEIATAGVDAARAARLRTLFELIRDAHLRGQAGAPRLAVRVDPADPRDGGILLLPRRALRVELPDAARRQWRHLYTAILADFLLQAVALPPAE